MRRRTASLLLVLIMLTLAVFWKLLQDEFPFKGWAHYYSTKILDRKTTGYDTMPPTDSDGHYLPYALGSNRGRARFIGYEWSDEACWPNGSSRPSSNGSLPPLIKRDEIIAVSPVVLFSILGAGWIGWSLLLTRELLARPPAGKGFEVVRPESCSPGASREL
jgi:hypothetical protein